MVAITSRCDAYHPGKFRVGRRCKSGTGPPLLPQAQGAQGRLLPGN